MPRVRQRQKFSVFVLFLYHRKVHLISLEWLSGKAPVPIGMGENN